MRPCVTENLVMKAGPDQKRILALRPTLYLHTGCLNCVLANAFYRVHLSINGITADSPNETRKITEVTLLL